MNNISEQEELELEKPGQRFDLLLDKIGFKSGRGRVGAFQEFLAENDPETFKDLNYTTARSWFFGHAPPMRKIDIIVDLLSRAYEIPADLTDLKTWWKVGGNIPFTEIDQSLSLSESLIDLQKLEFTITNMIGYAAGEAMGELSGDELNSVKESTLEFVRLFADPNVIECPHKFLDLIIKQQLVQLK